MPPDVVITLTVARSGGAAQSRSYWRPGHWSLTATANVIRMEDKEIIGRIGELIETERALRARRAEGRLSTADEHAALRSAEEALDQCWDLLRQRRALREFGADPSQAQARPTDEVEGYLQ